MDEELLTIDEVARLLKCSRRSVVNYRDRGQLVGYRAGPRRWLFKKADVLAFLQRYEVVSKTEQEDS